MDNETDGDDFDGWSDKEKAEWHDSLVKAFRVRVGRMWLLRDDYNQGEMEFTANLERAHQFKRRCNAEEATDNIRDMIGGADVEVEEAL